MKVSVCIPIYNFNSSALVSDLKYEIELNRLPVEIILIDDASAAKFRLVNKIFDDKTIRYFQLNDNLGRSKIRNLFLEKASGEYLIFLDCDCKIISSHFLQNYFKFINDNPGTKVLYGGRSIQKQKPELNKILRWNFANLRENLSLEKRQKKPFLSFQTNNFLTERAVFEAIQFNENLNNYGYEDLQFALDLKDAGIEIKHINNPVLNIDLETNEKYLEKVEESILSLASMLKDPQNRSKIKTIKLVKAYLLLEKTGLKFLFIKFFNLRRKIWYSKLAEQNTSLIYLDLYKLGLLCVKEERKF